MKKILGILIVLLLTSSVFGQGNFNNLSEIETGDWSKKNHITHFTTEYNGWKYFYMLAYERDVPIGNYGNSERNVYLYTHLMEVPYQDFWTESQNKREKEAYLRDARWVRACRSVVLTPYYNDALNSLDVDFWTYDEKTRNSSNSSVVVEGNTVTFTLDLVKMEDGDARIIQKTIVFECTENRVSSGYYYKLIND